MHWNTPMPYASHAYTHQAGAIPQVRVLTCAILIGQVETVQPHKRLPVNGHVETIDLRPPLRADSSVPDVLQVPLPHTHPIQYRNESFVTPCTNCRHVKPLTSFSIKPNMTADDQGIGACSLYMLRDHVARRNTITVGEYYLFAPTV